ncbi:MAG: hypothetical protein HY667_03395 [Chloroflexi bacterium]|nr:hypothetical protein [Chloroflexota bacterium]
MDNTLEQEIRAALKDSHLSCAIAWEIAKKHRINRLSMGEAVDMLGVRIVDCQLGCFGVRKATHGDLVNVKLNASLAQEIQRSLSDDGILHCAIACKIAQRAGVTPKEVGDAATLMHVHIGNCQLGCF